MGFSRQEYWSGLPALLQWTTFCQTSPPWIMCLGWPHTACLSFTELDKAVVLVWLDWIVFCEYGFSVSALWCPLATSTILLGFLLPWAWGIPSQLLQQSVATTPYLGRGVSPHSRPSWPWMWSSSSRPFWTRAVTAPWTSTVILVPEPYFLVWEHTHIHNFHWELWQGHMMKFYSRFSDEKTEAQGN